MKKIITQMLSLVLVLFLLPPISTPPGGGELPPDEEPGISVCGDDWRDNNTRE